MLFPSGDVDMIKYNFLFKIKVCITILIVSQLFFMPWISTSHADHNHEKRERGHRYDKEPTHRHDEIYSSNQHRKKDKGNETSGLVAAFLFGAANVMVLLSILLRALNRSARISNSTKERLRKINKIQKKYLLPLHYILNPIAMIVALTHFFLSYCRSSSLPEWGLAGIAILVVMGVLIKLKMLPPKFRKPVYRFHTNPLPVSILLIVLFIGHGIVD